MRQIFNLIDVSARRIINIVEPAVTSGTTATLNTEQLAVTLIVACKNVLRLVETINHIDNLPPRRIHDMTYRAHNAVEHHDITTEIVRGARAIMPLPKPDAITEEVLVIARLRASLGRFVRDEDSEVSYRDFLIAVKSRIQTEIDASA
jgi:hypothetical protein